MKKQTSALHASRRDFLKIAGLTTGAASFSQSSATVFAETSSPKSPVPPVNGIIDTHIHLWAADRMKYPLAPNPMYDPGFASTIEQWEADREGTGIVMAIRADWSP